VQPTAPAVGSQVTRSGETPCGPFQNTADSVS